MTDVASNDRRISRDRCKYSKVPGRSAPAASDAMPKPADTARKLTASSSKNSSAPTPAKMSSPSPASPCSATVLGSRDILNPRLPSDPTIVLWSPGVGNAPKPAVRGSAMNREVGPKRLSVAKRGTIYRCRTVSEKRCCYPYALGRWNAGACGHENGMAQNLTVVSNDPPLGSLVPSWSPRPLPTLTGISGRICRVEPIDSTRHGEALYAAYATDREGRLWTYLPWGPYSGPEELCTRILPNCIRNLRNTVLLFRGHR